MRIRTAGLLVDAEPAVTVEVHVHPNATETVDADQPEVPVAGVANRRVQDAGRRPMQVDFLNAVRPQGGRWRCRSGGTDSRQHQAVARVVREVVILVQVHGHGHCGRVDARQVGVHRPVRGRGARRPPVEAGADGGVTGRISRGVRQGYGKHAAKRANAADQALAFHVAVVGKVASHVHVGRPIVRANAIATGRPADGAQRSVHVVGRVGNTVAVEGHVEVAPRRGAAVVTADFKAPVFAAVGRHARANVIA